MDAKVLVAGGLALLLLVLGYVAISMFTGPRNNKVELSYVGPDAPCVTGMPDLDPVIYTPNLGNLFKKKKVKWELAADACSGQLNEACYWEIAYIADPAKGQVSGDHLEAVDPIECDKGHTQSKVDRHSTHDEDTVEWPYQVTVYQCVLDENTNKLVRGNKLCESDPRVYIKR